MKKIVILAISAILAANVSAQEQQRKEFPAEKQLSKEERVEADIKRFTFELMLSDKQIEKFAATYREYAAKLDELFEKNVKDGKCEKGKVLTDEELDKLAKKRFEGLKELADVQAKFYDKFRNDLSARQVERVMRFNEQCCHRHCGERQCDRPGEQHGNKYGQKQFDKREWPNNGFGGPQRQKEVEQKR